MIILDTDVVSEPMRRAPDPKVIRWLDQLDENEVYLTAITAAELLWGVSTLPHGARRNDLGEQIRAMLDDEFLGKVLAFDLEAARLHADILSARLSAGHSIEPLDAQIAAIARLHGATVATRNIEHFTECGVELINPWGN